MNTPRVSREQADNTITVTGCGDCPMYTKMAQWDYQYCAYPNKQQSCTMKVDMFKDCPIRLHSSLTIQLKQDAPQT